MTMLLVKSHVKGYVKKDGTVVKDHETRVSKKVVAPQFGKPAAHQFGLFGGSFGFLGGALKKPTEPKAYHPGKDDEGKSVGILHPHADSDRASWKAGGTVTVTPGGRTPASLNGVKLAPWGNAPKSDDEWADVDGQADLPDEPDLLVPFGKKAATGIIILEPDGRAWVVCPTNGFGGYKNTFPKGKLEDSLPLQANAIKECFEESGLQVEIDSYLGDLERTTSMTRYYIARRVGGTPAAMGWESQAVQLVPVRSLVDHMDAKLDKLVAGWIDSLAPDAT